ncbi:MAG: hypothetical protein GY815_14815, partial [Gammaproteobacteria bacterium]|nr:hypothetical protein [Gammaproteobacteria bacterium]
EEVVFCIFKRPDKKDADTSKVLAPKNRPFGFKYVVRNGQSTLGEEGGYYEMPAFVSRWRKVSGSKWGHGPVAVATGDVLSANQLVEATPDSLPKVIDPVTFAEQGAADGTLDLDRGGYNIVNDIKGIRTHESKAKFVPATMSLHDLRESIKQALHQDELALKESPAMTATEANIRY